MGLDLRDARQTESYAKMMESFGAKVIKPHNTYFIVWSGPSIRIEYPVDKMSTIISDCKVLDPEEIYIIHDPMYTGSALLKNWVGERSEFHSSRVMLGGRTTEDLWAGLSKQHRNSIRQAWKKQVTIGYVSMDEFMRLYEDLGKRKGFSTVQRRGLEAACNFGVSYLRGVYTPAKELAAVAYVEVSDRVVRYGYGAGDPKYYSYRPSNYLHWTIMEDACITGKEIYDLGGGSNLFKRGFGSKMYPYEQLWWNKEENGPLLEVKDE